MWCITATNHSEDAVDLSPASQTLCDIAAFGLNWKCASLTLYFLIILQ